MTIYIKLACEAMSDPKVLAVGPEGFALWVKGLLYSKQHGTEGLVPTEALQLVGIGLKNAQETAEVLVAAGLWKASKQGWTVGLERWEKWQTPTKEIEAKKEKNRERLARWRARADKCNASVTPDETPMKRVSKRVTKRGGNALVTLPDNRLRLQTDNNVQTTSGGSGPPPVATARPPDPVDDPPPKPQPFETVDAVLHGVALKLGVAPPTDTEVRRWLSASSPVRRLADKFGVEAAIELGAYAMTHVNGCSWHRVWESNASLSAQMLNGVESSFKKNARETLAEADRRLALEGH